MRTGLVIATLMAGCTSEGTFDLVLTLPSAAELRPNGMTTVTVVLTEGDMPPVATTSVLDGGSFSGGDLASATDVQIDVLLRDGQNRIVGVGEAPDPVDIPAGEKTEVTIPVRRPFVYASDGSMLHSFDPTLDQSDMNHQGVLGGATSPRVVVSVHGDRLAIVGASQLAVISTDTNKPMGSPINLPGMARDAAAVPGTNKVAVAHDGGIAIVDLDSGMVQNAAVGAVDRVTVGPNNEGKLFAHGLINRVEPPLIPVASCGGQSMIVSVDIDAPAATAPRALPEPTSDLAAAPEAAQLFATLPCSNKVVKTKGGIEGEAVTFEDFATLERPAAVTVDGSRVWAVGTKPAKIDCSNGQGGTSACSTSSAPRCPSRFTSGSIAAANQGAQPIVASIPITGGMPITIAIPSRRESMIDTDDPVGQHSQALRSLGVVPIDFVVLPGGQYIGLVTANEYYVEELTASNNVNYIFLPCLDAKTYDWLLLDVASSSVAQRVRTSCQLTVGPSDDQFPNWACDAPPMDEGPKGSMFQPISVGALFGAR